MTEEDRKELVNLLMTKIFCVSQNAYNMTPLNSDYLSIVELLSRQDSDRSMLIDAFGSLFKGKSSFAPQPFENIERVVRKIYDSYMPKSYNEPLHSLNFVGFSKLRGITSNFFRQNLQ